MVCINKLLAESFILKVNRQMGYKINVFNEKAIIIASTDRERVGDFHSGVHRMIRDNLPMETVYRPTKDMIGVRNGANLLIVSNDIPVGAVGITGDPDKIMDALRMVKMTLETMLEYETKKRMMIHRKTKGGEFVYGLLFQQPYSSEIVDRLARMNGFDEAQARVPIMMTMAFTDHFEERIISEYMRLACYDEQDIPFMLDDNLFVVFKAVPNAIFNYYREYAKNFATELRAVVGPYTPPLFEPLFYCGVPQLWFEYYNESVEQLHWLARHRKKGSRLLHYFTDHQSEYVMELIPRKNANTMLSSLCATVCGAMGKELFIETADALLSNNLHLEKCAKEMYLHKNSVMSRLRKIKEALNIEPLENNADRILLQMLVDYLKLYGDNPDFFLNHLPNWEDG